MSKINTHIDTIKAVLIVLVVFAHTLERCKFAGIHDVIVLYNFIVLFHMPMFLFISGYLTHVKQPSSYRNGVLRIIETFIVFDIIRILFVEGAGSIQNILTPRWTLWYLVTLAYYRIIAYFLKDVKAIIILALSFLISVLGGFVPIDRLFSIQRTFTFMPFFFLGFVLSRDEIGFDWLKKIPFWVSIPLILAALSVFFFWDQNFHHIFAGFRYYTPEGLVNWWSRSVYLIASMLVGLSVLSLVPDIGRTTFLGRQTLFIYIYHSFLIRYVFSHVTPWLGNDSIPVILLCTVLNLLLLYLMSKVKIFTILLNPVSYYLNSSKQ